MIWGFLPDEGTVLFCTQLFFDLFGELWKISDAQEKITKSHMEIKIIAFSRLGVGREISKSEDLETSY